MSEIAQYFGHSNTSMTEKYARYSLNYLRGVAGAAEVGTRFTEPEARNFKICQVTCPYWSE